MAERRVSFKIDLDLAKGSKEAHAVTIDRIAQLVAYYATEEMEKYGYSIRRSQVETTLHYVRHVISHIIKSPKKLRIVRSKPEAG